ncbi:MAG TPA: hypothetical protein VK506_12795, partial [Conexibacter sp.]|nr:hypothetical protein [Conexibacter sp.]
ALPLDDVDSASIDLAGRFAELMERLGGALRDLAEPHSLDGWIAAIAHAADALTATAPRDAWQRAELQALLFDLGEEACGDGEGEPSTVELELADVRSLLADRLAGRPTRTSFRTGHLTVCTFQPMRSVPHRMVCLLGLDDEVFQRRGPRDGDDLLLGQPLVGDRDRRSEDRQIVLDALMAATDRLVIAYTDWNERANAPLSPAAPVAVLLDVVDRTVQLDGDWRERPHVRRPRDAVTLQHPLQPFAAQSFTPGGLLPDRPWSFDRTALGGARALAAAPAPRPPFLDAPLAAPEERLIDLDDLVAFARSPIRAFLRQRLGMAAARRAADVRDELAIELDARERSRVGERLLAARLAGVEPEAAIAAERARGVLPPGRIGTMVLDELIHDLNAVLGLAREQRAMEADATVDVRIDLPDGRTLAGAVAGVAGDRLVDVAFARVGPGRRLAAWVRLLALTAAEPERAVTAVTVGRARRDPIPTDARTSVALIGALAAEPAVRRALALEQLAALVALYDRGMREPLPIYPETSAAHVTPWQHPETAWEGHWTRAGARVPGEQDDVDHLVVLGEQVPFAELLREPPRADEVGAGWDEREPTRFGRYARRWWSGLLAFESVRDRR